MFPVLFQEGIIPMEGELVKIAACGGKSWIETSIFCLTDLQPHDWAKFWWRPSRRFFTRTLIREIEKNGMKSDEFSILTINTLELAAFRFAVPFSVPLRSNESIFNLKKYRYKFIKDVDVLNANDDNYLSKNINLPAKIFLYI
jgi:hypothetical protein